METRLYGDLDDADFILTDKYLLGWAALFWCLGAATVYVTLLF